MSRVTVDHVLDVVSEHAGIPRRSVLGRVPAAACVDARHLAMWLSARVAGLPTGHIVACFGREHSTVLYALRKVERRLGEDAAYAALARRLGDAAIALAGAPALHGEPSSAADQSGADPRRALAAAAGLWTEPKARRLTQRHLARALKAMDAAAALWAGDDPTAARMAETARDRIAAVEADLVARWADRDAAVVVGAWRNQTREELH